MPTSHFIDVHVLGQPQLLQDHAEVIREAVQGLEEDDSSVFSSVFVGSPEIVASGPPWPKGQGLLTFGVVLESSPGLAERKLERLLGDLCELPGIRLAAALHWASSHESVRFWAITPGSKECARALVEKDALFNEVLGCSLLEAMGDNALIDAIGDRMLPMLLTSPGVTSMLEPLVSEHKALHLDETLPVPSTASRPRRI